MNIKVTDVFLKWCFSGVIKAKTVLPGWVADEEDNECKDSFEILFDCKRERTFSTSGIWDKGLIM